MQTKMKIKMGIDVWMTALLLLLMAYQVTGQKYHEWFGTGMLVLFLLHNILNIRWYGNLCKARYGFLRVIQTIVNFSDFEQSAVTVFAEHTAIMAFWVFAAYYLSKGKKHESI